MYTADAAYATAAGASPTAYKSRSTGKGAVSTGPFPPPNPPLSSGPASTGTICSSAALLIQREEGGERLL